MGASLTKQEGSLCTAARGGKLDVIQSCLDDGANVNCLAFAGCTPLHFAASHGQYGAADLLLTRGAAIAAKNDAGETPLYVAALRGHLATVRLLLEKGAATAAKTKRGDTPLHVAARYGYLTVVRLLLEKGADVTAKNGNDETPLELAKSKLHFHVALLLSSKENNDEPLAVLLLVASLAKYAGSKYGPYVATLLLYAIVLGVVYTLFLVMLWTHFNKLFLVMLYVVYQLYIVTTYLLGALLYNLYLLLLWTRADPLPPQSLFLAARDGDVDAVRFRLYEGHSVNAKGEVRDPAGSSGTNKGTKLTDFGASRVAEEDDLMTNGIGTYQWMAPEVISGTNYGALADVYSFGIMLSEFATHQVPYADLRHPDSGKALPQHYVLNNVRESTLHPTFDGEGVPAWVKDIGLQCLSLYEEDRPTALQTARLHYTSLRLTAVKTRSST
ncbi:serine/threonine protein kinase [Saprolegnia diclina VS20]|uniref:Serine/threonine protein kinase n=1 Tax=Saprolegnia diclina (strain VS20) TaxID=1156394 RepID=T0PI07_SAPDV|nr:serine/threonine protein kinase [Saprolegnia diclina VS20]EQC24974.1 serine/threonine protein kinase [Saprolegnia diclina VS20]|eukprot:XP_008621594.1 serine/threonine protein kinase [Saprolegnia diclina VS20]